MDALLGQIEHIAAAADVVARRSIIQMLRNLAVSLENPAETINRVGYLHLQTAAIRIGFDLKLFTLLSAATKPLTLLDLSQATGADEAFLDRLLTYLAAHHVIAEKGQDLYGPTNVTKNLSEKVSEAGITHCFETIGPTYQALPGFMKSNQYQNPTDPLHTVFQTAFDTKLHQFDWFTQNPANLKYFNDYMASRREPELSWLSVYPVESEAGDRASAADAPLYVNIGGGIGHQCAQFKQKFPHLPGRVILQDLPHSIEKALPTPGVENMAHNFFDPQPVKGAKFYFTRGVCHNHPNDKVALLLKNIKEAMSPESVILLDEYVLPDTGVSEYGAALDLTMMAAFAAVERTESQWKEIFASVGLRLVQTYTYNPGSYERVMDVRLALEPAWLRASQML